MHFSKTLMSLFAIAGFATAQVNDVDRRDVEAAREQYLAARDEYAEKRELFLRKNAPTHDGYCNRADYGDKKLWCLSRKTGTVCGHCKPNAKAMDKCVCPG